LLTLHFRCSPLDLRLNKIKALPLRKEVSAFFPFLLSKHSVPYPCAYVAAIKWGSYSLHLARGVTEHKRVVALPAAAEMQGQGVTRFILQAGSDAQRQ
jgi:hypothetical protein